MLAWHSRRLPFDDFGALDFGDRQAELQGQQNVAFDHIAEIVSGLLDVAALGEKAGGPWNTGNDQAPFVRCVFRLPQSLLKVAQEGKNSDFHSIAL
jgi:hypothetical protein